MINNHHMIQLLGCQSVGLSVSLHLIEFIYDKERKIQTNKEIKKITNKME